ncbi:flavin reductase family protein [Rummeliibacillus suwonensis]|jgi:flavin reductase (DIM6/NTAB) family NADH-FMN oxidoreductase RutF|uniref:flavin reductase family protein n=1 Tax=Rummeliibacillus suwonensis TaxID=1306154 RepID=UPI0011B56983|nr:flavin reductase family protein [Rummeliibacillus suwonensis]MBO2535417.1 flavin reductase [Rummeliibacillus suwonensis]
MDAKLKKSALRGITYGLYLVGTKDESGLNAFVGNFLTQTSFEPPLVALAAKVGTRSQQQIASSGVFSVNVLESGQKDMVMAFFKSFETEDNKMAGFEFSTEETGCPIFKEALRYFECKVVDKIEKGDHFIYIGEVINAGVNREGEPLPMKETGFYYGG